MLGSVNNSNNNNINVITSGPNLISGGISGQLIGTGNNITVQNNHFVGTNNNNSNLEDNLKLLFSLNAIEVRDDFEEVCFFV